MYWFILGLSLLSVYPDVPQKEHSKIKTINTRTHLVVHFSNVVLLYLDYI